MMARYQKLQREMTLSDNDQHQPEALTDWSDVGALLAEMKRRAGVTTDRDLAHFMGAAQTTVSYWRTRRQVPQAAILKFEHLLAIGGQPMAERLAAARAIALRVPEYWYQQALAEGIGGGRSIFYRAASEAFQVVVDEAAAQLEAYERQTGQGSWELLTQLIDDERMIKRLVDRVRQTNLAR
jgi:hypothetical protein